MKHLSKIAMLLLCTIFASAAFAQSVLISEDLSQTADQSSILDIQSSDKGILIPRMTIDQRDSIVQPAAGLLVFCTDDDSFYYMKLGQWEPIQGETITGFTITDDGNQKQSITSRGVNSTSINAKGSLYVNYDSNDDGSNNAFVVRGDQSGDDPTSYDFKIQEGTTMLNDKPLVFSNGIAKNLVSRYLAIPNFDQNSYLTIKTEIPFEKQNMMSSLKFKYWSYQNNFEIDLGWYTWRTDTLGTFINAATAVATGIFSPIMDYRDIVMSVHDGKIWISIPQSYISTYGSMSVESNLPILMREGDWSNWYKGWKVSYNTPPNSPGYQRNVRLSKIENIENFANTDLVFESDRTHNLNGNKLTFDGGRSIIVKSTHSDWNAQFIQNDPNGAGVLIKHPTNSSGEYSFNVLNNTDLSRKAFVVKGNGQVGVGTSSPAGAFEVVGNSAGVVDMSVLNESTASTAQARLRIGTRPNYDKGGMISFLSASNTLEFSNTGDPNGSFTFVGRDGSGHVERLRIYSNGNIGIGTKTPQEKLHITRGNIRIDRDGGCCDPYLHIIPDSGEPDSWMMGIDDSGNKLTFAFGLPASTTGTPFGTTADKLTILSNGNVGIGTSTPDAELQITADAGSNAELHINASSAHLTSILRFQQAGNNKWGILSNHQNPNSLRFYNYTSGTVALQIDQQNNIGIGTTSASAKLDINGNIKIADGTQQAGYVLTSDANGLASWQPASGGSYWVKNTSGNISFDNNIGIGISTPSEKLHIQGNSIFQSNGADWFASLKIDVNSNGNGVLLEAFRKSDPNNKGRFIALNPGGGNVGIGTANPESRLHVNGFIRGQTYIANVNDGMEVLFSKNTSASGAPKQLIIKHQNGNVKFENLRGALVLDLDNQIHITDDNNKGFKFLEGGYLRIEHSSDVPLAFVSESDNDWQYIPFTSPSGRNAYFGIESNSNDFIIAKERSGDIKLMGANVGINESSPEEKLDVEGSVKISEVLKLQPQTALPPVANSSLGDICVFNTKLYFFNGSAWKEVQLM